MRKITSLSGKVKKVPSTQADPNRYEFLNLNNAEPDLGVAAGNNYVLTSDTVGNRIWTSQVDIITNNVDQAYVNALNVNADTLDSQEGTYYLDFTNFTNIPDPKIDVILSGDVTGSANTTLTDLGNGLLEITTIVADDSHNHTIENIDGLQNALDGKIDANANTILSELLTVDGSGSGLDADLLDGQEGTYYLDFTNFTNIPDPNIEVTLTGDVTGSANTTLTDLGNGTISITATVADDSHNHTIANIDGLQTALDGKADETITITAGSGLTGGGNLTTNRTISHADTSSQANTNNTNGSVVQNVEIDTYGHVTLLSSVNLDTRYVNTSGDTMTGFLTLHADPTNALHAATKEYVDTIAAASLHYHDPVRVEAPSELTASYNNGTSGVGATLTGGNEVLVIDGVTVALNDRVLVYEQTNTAHNGVYSVTQLGVSGTTPWILTRTTDTDSYAASDPDALGQGDAFFVLEGDTGAGELYVMTTEGTITFGTTGITFSQIGASQVYSAGSGLQLNDTVFSHSDTSSQADIGPLTGGNVVSAVDLDGFGHVTSLSTRTLTLGDLGFTGDLNSDNYVGWNLLVDNVEKDQVTSGENVNFVGGSNITLTYSAANNTITFEGTDTLANDATITLSAGGGLSGGGNFTTDQSVNEIITFSHADTSSQASVDNSGGTVIQDVTLDTYGHITSLGSVDLDGRYYTETEADNRFVNVTGDTMTGNLNMNNANITNVGNITFNDPGPNEGIEWLAGNLWKIYESPDDLTTNSGGNLQFVEDTTRRMTLRTDGQLHLGTDRVFADNYHPNADKWTTARTLSLTGAVTGSASIDGSGNVSLSTTATSDPTLTINGDASGSATFTNLGNATLTLTIADDSHTHDGRYYTETEADNRFVNVAGDTMTGDLTIPDKIIHSGDTDTAIRFPAADTFTVETAGSERMRILSDGNVGIGSTSPAEKLHVNGTGRVRGSGLVANNISLRVGLDNNTANGIAGPQYGLYVSQDGARYTDQTAILALLPASTGRFGNNYKLFDGETSISTKANQKGYGVDVRIFNSTGNYTTQYGVKSYAESGMSSAPGFDGRTRAYAGYFEAQGNGTLIGNRSIVVQGSVPASGSYAAAYEGYVNGAQLFQVRDGLTVFNESGVDQDFRVESDTSSHAFFLEGSSSNVGIGTASPTTKLDVAGNIDVKNSTTPTKIDVYNTYTDASNYERGFMRMQSNFLQIGVEGAGTGSNRSVSLMFGAAEKLRTTINSVVMVDAVPFTSGTYDLGTASLKWGELHVNNSFVGDSKLTTETATLATVTQTQIASFAAATYASGKFVIQAKDSVTGEVHLSELLVVHDGTTASATEYGVIHTGSNPLATYDVDINSGNVRILATASSANSTTYKVSETLITA